MFGGVPISVTSPPRIEPKASGISSTAGARPAFAADCSAAGISSASAPTLFMKADSSPATPDRLATCAPAFSIGGSRRRAISSTAPAFCRPRLMTSTIATVTVAGWPNPAKASLAGTTPAPVASSSAPKATMS
jgi:hypothetical protein